MLGLLKRLFGRKKKKRLKAGYLVVDFSDDGVWVGNTFIPRNSILSIDTERKIILFKDVDGAIKEISYAKNPS